jgi:hypothetical protein
MRTRNLIPVPGCLDERRPGFVRIRAIRSADASELQRFYADLSPESRRTRFLYIGAGLTPAQSVSFCTTDHDHRAGFVAVVVNDPIGREQIVGHL